MQEWISDQSCTQCAHNTTGDHCQYCAEGFYGDPRNGGHCEECHCNGQATTCQRETGDCFCTTKGVTGKNCSKCEQKYYGDPENNQPCYYELTVDFIFTFKLDQDDPKDKYVNQINFFSIPHKVKVHNFSTPIKIQISFSQSPPINWVLFFVIFAA
uniref:Laminin EGF-like domain-containing protein n=1 Tax=Parascaris equorum TaxID=6256 RepID=A0A914RTY7_PAREQ